MMIKMCGNCEFFTGEECDGVNEGSEAYSDDDACDYWEPIESIEISGRPDWDMGD